jgi:hypothetical protein
MRRAVEWLRKIGHLRAGVRLLGASAGVNALRNSGRSLLVEAVAMTWGGGGGQGQRAESAKV